MTGIVPVGAAAMRHRIRGRIAGVFLDAHAITPDDAIAFSPRPGIESRSFARMLATGVVRQPQPDRFYYDLATHYARAEARRRWSVPAAIVIAVVLAGIAMLFYRG